MWVKICANTTLQDALLAASLGADALGFIFAPSPRQISVAQAAAITPHLPPSVERVGVFATADVAEIVAAVQQAGLSGVQLHGGGQTELARELRAQLPEGVQILQTVHWVLDAAGDNATAIEHQLQQIADAGAADRVLVDSKVGAALGGTGVAFPWSQARSVLEPFRQRLPIVVAGGLHADNVAEAIRELRPWGVDVASGVEAAPGRKDEQKLKMFLRGARGQ
ncbi:MAG: phosphoribosylanthranilate isomerase [Acidobacteriota bacterium]|nr:phosphoribosylanthranilate isomerase [Acidobacteriota bacterium]